MKTRLIKPNYFEVALFWCFCCCWCCFAVVFVLDIYIVVLVTLYVALRLILIDVEFGWVVLVVGWVCKVIIVSNPTFILVYISVRVAKSRAHILYTNTPPGYWILCNDMRKDVDVQMLSVLIFEYWENVFPILSHFPPFLSRWPR